MEDIVGLKSQRKDTEIPWDLTLSSHTWTHKEVHCRGSRAKFLTLSSQTWTSEKGVHHTWACVNSRGHEPKEGARNSLGSDAFLSHLDQ